MNLKSSQLRNCGSLLLAGWLIAESVPAFAQQTNHSNPRDFSAFQIINDRNIFDPNRRPRTTERPVQRSTPRTPQIVDTFSLVGTMSFSNRLIAFFDGSNSDYRRSMEPGGKIAGFTTAEIRHDVVKLVQGTNSIELKVGMQMRRSEDGHWSASESSGGGYNSASNSGGGSNRSSWGRGGGRTRNGGGNGGTNGANRPNGNSDSNNADQNNPSEQPPDAGGPDTNLDPNDPVARLMLRRLQEEAAANGGLAPQPPMNPQPVEQPPADSSSNDVPAAGNPPADDNNNTQNPPPEPQQ